MKKLWFLRAAFIVLALNSALLQCQQIAIQAEPGKQTVLTRADIEALPHAKVTTHAADGPITYDGVTLKDVLQKAGVAFGESLKGKRLASYLLVEAADSYRVVIALPFRKSIRHLLTGGLCWLTRAMANRSMQRRAHIASSFLMRSEWRGGCAKLPP